MSGTTLVSLHQEQGGRAPHEIPGFASQDRRGYTDEEWRQYDSQWTEEEWEDWRVATPDGIFTTIPIELVGAGIQTAEWNTTLDGGTHCQHPSIAFVKLCRREFCALRQCLAQSIFIV